MMAMKDPAAFCELLKSEHGYKLKGDCDLKYHLGCDFGRDPDGTTMVRLSMWKRCWMRMSVCLAKSLWYTPLPLEKGDHPELDMSPELNEEGHAIYMSLVRQSQWPISLGRFDIACTIMTMSRFRAAPREGHMKRMKRIYGYVKQYQKGCIRVRVDLPDYTYLHIYI